MKKYIFLMLIIIFITGCGREKSFICTSNIKNDSLNYELNAKYQVFYKGSYVTKINKVEKYISKEKDILKYFENFFEAELKTVEPFSKTLSAGFFKTFFTCKYKS